MPYKDFNKQRAYQIHHGRLRMRNKRYKYIQMYGGKCVDCGNTDERVLEFHHRDRTTKNKITWTYSEKRVKAELDKCELVCANCHNIREWYFYYPEEKLGELAESGLSRLS